MSFAVGAFSGGARGAGGGGGGSSDSKRQRQRDNRNRQDPNAPQNDQKDGRGGIEGDIETPNTTNTPMATASLMFHALTSGIGVLGRDGPDKK